MGNGIFTRLDLHHLAGGLQARYPFRGWETAEFCGGAVKIRQLSFIRIEKALKGRNQIMIGAH